MRGASRLAVVPTRASARREKAREVSWEASSSVRARRRSAALSLKCAAPHALIQFDLMANKDRARVSSRRI